MIKKSIFAIAVFFLISASALSGVACAYWIWTPETKKFTNPKYAVKDSPKEQFDWAMSFYDAKDFQRAATEFEKLAKQYEFSEYASKAQYYVGLCYENMNKYYIAYQNYQKAIDNFPHIANTEEILAREFAIANLYLSKPGPKVLGADIMAPLDRAVEIFKKIVENAPYGKFAEDSQFKLGEALKKSERYEEAVQAFHKIVEDYPKSKLTTQAMYEESQCAYKASLKPAYDAAATDNAIKTFEKFVGKNKDADLAKTADTTMRRLKDNVAEKSFKAAEFYESQGKTQAAIIYYQDVIDAYPDSSFVDKAKVRIEALKTKDARKAAAFADRTKKKSKEIAREKKPWSPFKIWGERPRTKAETTTPEAPKKKRWNPFSFETKKQKTDQTDRTDSAKEASPKKKPWKLFDFGAKKESVAKEASPKKKAWSLFGLGTKKEPVVKEAAKHKDWKPLNFDAIKKAKPPKADIPVAETPVVETSVAERPMVEIDIAAAPVSQAPVVEASAVEAKVVEAPVVETPVVETKVVDAPAVEAQKQEEAAAQAQEAPKKKAWRPFNFDTKRSPVTKEASKDKGWKPLYFGTNDKPMATTKRRW